MPSENQPHDSDRAERAGKIIANPTAFKVCEGCESIVTAKTTVCSNCSAYRFDNSPQRVIEQAKLLASRERRSVISADLD